MHPTLRSHPAFFFALLLAACGGSSAVDPATSSTGQPSQPAAPTSIVRGTVSAGGALTVAGVAFKTAGATLTAPDSSADPIHLESEGSFQDHLRPGMIVTVRGDVSGATGTAREIEFHQEASGEVGERGEGFVTIAGQQVSIDDSTHVEDALGHATSVAAIGPGDELEVSGFADDHGGLRASFLRKRDAAHKQGKPELRGFVLAAPVGNLVSLSHSAGGPVAAVVDLSGLQPIPALAAGDFVEVKGKAALDASGNLVASALKAEDRVRGAAQDHAEVEGFVESASGAELVVAGQRVVTSSGTSFVGGGLADLLVGLRVEAEGQLGADGSLQASRIAIEDGGGSMLGNVEVVGAANTASSGSFQVFGLKVRVGPSTCMHGGGSRIDLSSLQAGQAVEVRGHFARDGSGEFVALRVDRAGGSSASKVWVRGVVSAATAPSSVTLFGLSLDVSAADKLDGNEAPLSSADFFAAVHPGVTRVKASWRKFTGLDKPVHEIEIEAGQ